MVFKLTHPAVLELKKKSSKQTDHQNTILKNNDSLSYMFRPHGVISLISKIYLSSVIWCVYFRNMFWISARWWPHGVETCSGV